MSKNRDTSTAADDIDAVAAIATAAGSAAATAQAAADAAQGDADTAIAGLAALGSMADQNSNAVILTGSVEEAVYAWVSTSGAVTGELDPANGTIQTLALTGNITALTDNLANGESITLHIDDGTAYTITWPAMQWAGGAAPTLATTGYTVVVLWKVGGVLYGQHAGDMA